MASSLRFCDKLLPDQPEQSREYRGDDFFPALYDTIIRVSGIPDPHQALQLEYSEKFTVEEMGSNPVSLHFLKFLIRISGAHRVLEIGTFIGVSTMVMAQALPRGGKIVTIEKFDHFADIARSNFSRNKIAERIELINGDALDIIDTLPPEPPFDLIFIDGNKERYRDYIVASERLLSPKGLIVVDDCFFHGDAIQPSPVGEKGRGVRAALDYVAGRSDLFRLALPLANGLLLLTRA